MQIANLQDKKAPLVNVLSSGWFIIACGLSLALICSFVVTNVNRTITNLEQDKQIFESQNLRGGYASISDIQRLLLVMQDAVTAGEMTNALRNDLMAANDMLYARAESFYTTQETALSFPSSNEAVDSLWPMINAVDAAAAAGFPDLNKTWATLLTLSEQSRIHLVDHLDRTQRFQGDLLQAHLDAVTKTREIVWATLAGLILLAISALFLLRGEVVANKARRVAEAQITHLAFHDSLTGLSNRLSFQERLGVRLNQNHPFTLVSLDIDEFKAINDTYGHAAGDAILIHVARVLQDIATEHDGLVACLGGDEFAVAVPITNLKKMEEICDQILSQISTYLVFEGEEITAHASIGIAASAQISGAIKLDADDLARAADFALYAAKTAGRRCYKVYDKALEVEFLARRKMVDDLPSAIARGEMEVFLQPKVRLATSEIYGFEALVRWRRDNILVPPDDFIAIAEKSGQIIDLDRSVLRQSCRIIADFNRRHSTQFAISVNFSALQFNSDHCCTVVQDVLTETGLLPHLLTIEVTETAELGSAYKTKPIIEAIQALGVRIAIDDFGAGFSSLSYLRKTFANEIRDIAKSW